MNSSPASGLTPVWMPGPSARKESSIGRFIDFVNARHGLELDDWYSLHAWSIAELDDFWRSLMEFFEVEIEGDDAVARVGTEMPHVHWFPDVRLNYARQALGAEAELDRIAILERTQTRTAVELSFAELREQVARAAFGLRGLGVGPGDRVAAYLPNVHEAVVAFLATASIGAVWASCPPEFGPRSVIDRFSQIEPKVLLAVSGYGYRDRSIDRSAAVAEIIAGLPSLEHVVGVRFGAHPSPGGMTWEQLLGEFAPLSFASVPFEHPLYVLFSSGTTGLPKAIIHGHGGMLLEHMKNLGLSMGLERSGRLLQFTTTGWMMWNLLVSGLLLGASIVLVDGDPTWPVIDAQWRLAAETRSTMLGISPGLLMACRKAGVALRDLELSALRTIFTAGSPLPAEGYQWVYEELGNDVLLVNGSGGTDVCSALVSGSFIQPVYAGEISGPCLAVDAKAFDPDGNEIIDELGELVVTKPLPSMPVGLWGDQDRQRYRSTYFDMYPGVWRHGDWIRFTELGTCRIFGRSDATLNRAGVRLGTSEIYAVLEARPEIVDSLIVHLDGEDGSAGELLLFVVLNDGAELDADLRDRLRRELAEQLSPRHVPDVVHAVPGIPRNLSGKKLEVPVKKILQGVPATSVVNRDSLADPAALDAFVELAGRRPTRR